MSECEFCHEDSCILQIEYPDIAKCEHAKGKLRECTAKPEDLVDVCFDCGKPEDECECW